MRNQKRAVSAVLVVTASVVAAVAVGAFSGADAAGPKIIQSRTSGLIHLGGGAGGSAVLTSIGLPAGQWVLEGKGTAVNFGAADYIRCALTGSSKLDGATVHIGNGSSFASTMVNLAVVSGPVAVTWSCSHDFAGGTPYFDPDAILIARKV